MKTRKILFSVAMLSIVFTSCKKDDPEPNPDGSTQTCTILTGNLNDAMTLTNHNSDPSVPDYCVEGNFTIFSDVVVEPGVFIQMKNGSRIYVNGNGSFKCVGTANEEINIKGENINLKGQWQSIRFGSSSTNNRLEHTNVMGGGNDGGTSADAMVYVDFDGYVNIDNCYIGFSSTNGLKAADNGSQFGTIANSDFSFNDLHPIYIEAIQLEKVAASVTGTGNGIHTIQVDGGSISNAFTWSRSIIPYHIDGTIQINNVAVVQPGTKVYMGAGSRISVTATGVFSCIGTASNKIVFTGDNNTNGDWECIVFTQSTSTLNRFEHCELSYGGAHSTYQGIVTLWLPSYVRIGNSTIKNSARYGVFNESQNSTFIDDGNNVYTGNALGPIGF